MTEQSGRTLIEVIGVLAIAALMTAGAIRMYGAMHNRQMRTIASADLEQTVKNIRLLLQPRGDYTGLSVDFLVKAGALRSTSAPIGDAWTITADTDPRQFAITLTGLTMGECDFFTAAPPTWATDLHVNGTPLTDDQNYCLTSADNQISFIAE